MVIDNWYAYPIKTGDFRKKKNHGKEGIARHGKCNDWANKSYNNLLPRTVNIRKRIDFFEGNLDVLTEPGNGTSVLIEFNI